MRISTSMHDQRYDQADEPGSLQESYQPISDVTVVRALFDPACTLLKVFGERGTVAFWGNDGFHRSIRGTDFEIE